LLLKKLPKQKQERRQLKRRLESRLRLVLLVLLLKRLLGEKPQSGLVQKLPRRPSVVKTKDKLLLQWQRLKRKRRLLSKHF
jgi:hypothetical protein